MKRISILWAVLFTIFFEGRAQINITVNPADKKQTITGLGALMEPSMIDDLVFDIGCEVLRIFPGGNSGWIDEPINDDSDPNTLDLSKFESMTGSNLAAVQKAVKNGVKILATAGTPPCWQKDTLSPKMYWKILQSQGKPASEYMFFRYRYECGGELRSDMYDEFGEFAVGVVKKFKEQTGADLFAFIPQNEPEFPEPYWSCVYNATQMFNTTKAVGAKFASYGITTKLGYADQCFPQNNIISWAQLVNNDPVCKNYVQAFSNHDYSDDPNGGGMSTPGQWMNVFTEANRVTPVKEVWMDEGGPGYSDVKTESQLSIGGAYEFFKSMYYGNCNLFMVHAFPKKEAIRYGSIKNTIRFIRPGSYRINTSLAAASDSVYPLVFKDDSYNTTTIYLVNTSFKSKSLKINGLSGKYDVFQTSDRHSCNWIGQHDLANTITLPGMSVTTLVNNTANKLSSIHPVDTIVMIKNSGPKSFALTGINDGGDGNQTLYVTATMAPQTAQLFESVSTTYSSPDTTGKLNLVLRSDVTGMTYINIAVKDNSKALDSMFNEKVISVPAYVVPYINAAPTMDDIPDQNYTVSQISSIQMVSLTGISDGNDGKQKLSLLASTSQSSVATVTTSGSGTLKITPKAQGTTMVTVTLRDDGLNVGNGKGSITKTFVVNVGNVKLSGIEAENIVYPNPSNDIVYIRNLDMQFNVVQIFALNGKLMKEEKLTEESTSLSLGNVMPGTYIIKLSGNERTISQKIRIE